MLESKKILQQFGKRVVSRARANLTRENKNSTRNLYKNLDFKVKQSKNSIEIGFVMAKYAMFVDQGVRGANPKLVGKKGVQKAPLSKFSYKNKRPPLDMILGWVKNRNVRFRSKDGKFAQGSQRSLAFLIQRSIFAQGIKPTLFFTKPFKAAFKALPQDLIEAYKLDLDDFFKNKFD